MDDPWRWLGMRVGGQIYKHLRTEGPRRAQPIVEWVLSAEERRAGLRRPLRFTYLHERCGRETLVDRASAEALARDPKAFGRVYCWHCRRLFPAGAGGEFVWKGSTERVGS